ncbi:hypothetical protein [Ruegeria sp.]|uniref:hypothetical protein n=1 Tax=Ruegeria sp. TaxID=1879320 RepID=UPI003B0094B3
MATTPLNAEAKKAGTDKGLIDAVKEAAGVKHNEAVERINAYVLNGYEPPITAEKVMGNGSKESSLDHQEEADDDPFALDNLTVDGTSMEDLGIERPILVVPVTKPNPQDFFRVHPNPKYHLVARVLELKAEREVYLVTKAVWPLLPGETKLVKLVTYQTRHGGVALWPLKLAEDGARENPRNISARKAAELGETKWVRMQANMHSGSYDVVTSSHIGDPTWTDTPFQDLVRIAFGDGKLIDSTKHPVVKQLLGE